MRREIRARAVSLSPTMYFGYSLGSGFPSKVVMNGVEPGYSLGSGFPSKVVMNGVELQFCTKPDFGFSTCGSSSMVWKPCHSVADVLPSTGFDQSKLGDRRGTAPL